jgi:uncharacterized protein
MHEQVDLTILGERIILLPEKLLYWKGRETFVLADMHLGKSAHFRKSGLQVTSQVMEKDLSRLSRLMEQYQAKRIIILGDMFHSRLNSEWEKFCDWLDRFPVSVVLVKGNHDILPEELYSCSNIAVHTSLAESPFLFVHHPPAADSVPEGSFVFCGHIHPSVIIAGRARQTVRLECFCFTEKLAILPAFGSFTGNENIDPRLFDRVYVIAEGKMVTLNQAR